MRKQVALLSLFFLSATSLSFAQTEVRTATPADLGLTEVPSPMLADISLGGGPNKKPLSDPSLNGRTFYDTKRFVCDKARVPKITVDKHMDKKGAVTLEVTPTISTEWYRQDLNVTLAILLDGKEVRRQDWKSMTVGNDNSPANKMGLWVAAPASTKRPTAKFEFRPGEFEALFSDERAPVLRMIIEVVK